MPPDSGTGKSTVLREVWPYLEERIVEVKKSEPDLLAKWQDKGLGLLEERLRSWRLTANNPWVFSASFTADLSELVTVFPTAA